jgi:hypothetical protein
LDFDRTGAARGRPAPWREDAGRLAPEQVSAARAHSIEVEGLHSLELVGRVASNASAAACEEKMLRLARSSLKAGCW